MPRHTCTVYLPEGPPVVMVYCHRCRKGEPYYTRRPGWRLGPNICPDCPAPVVRLKQNRCAACGEDMLPGRRAFRVAIGRADDEQGATTEKEVVVCGVYCVKRALRARRSCTART